MNEINITQDEQDRKQGGRMWLVLTVVVCMVGYLVNGFAGVLVGLALVAGLYIVILVVNLVVLNRKRR